MTRQVEPRPKAKKKPRVPTKTQQLRAADALFSKIVRSAGRCALCGSTEFLQCAHGFSRRYRAVRWDERNTFALCRSDHVYYTHRPLEWDEKLQELWGPALYAELRQLALFGRNPDLSVILPQLQSRWEQIEKGEAA